MVRVSFESWKHVLPYAKYFETLKHDVRQPGTRKNFGKYCSKILYQNILFKNVCACYPQNTLASQMFQNFLFQLFSFQMTPLPCLESLFCWRYDVTNLPQFSRNYPKNALFQWLPNLRSDQLIFTLTFFLFDI